MESTLELTKSKKYYKNLKILIILPLLFLIISAIVTFFVLSPKYQANTQILVNQTKGDNPQFMAQEVQSNIQLVNTYKEIVKVLEF